MRRTVQIDGVLTDGEWDPFYTITDGPIQGTIYCNWDDDYLYLAARSDHPASVLFDVDAGGDGWLRGADNLEIVIGTASSGGAPTVAVRQLDAANGKDTPVWNDKTPEARALLVAVKQTNGVQVVELAVPRNMGSLVLRAGAVLGLRAEFLPPGPAAAYQPTAPFEPHLLLEAMLVGARVQAAEGITPRLTLSDRKCVAGQKLFATLEIFNQRDVAVPLKSVLWTGQGASAAAVNTLREVAVPRIPANKTLKLGYRTVLPDDLSVGSYTLTVTAEIDGGKQIQSAASFTVVEPIHAQMSSTPAPVAIVGTTRLTVHVGVFSAVPDHMRGDVELNAFPGGWELQGGRKRSVYIDREDGRKVIGFQFKLPSNTPAGGYMVEATVHWHNRSWPLRHTVHVIRGDTPAPPKAEGTKPAE